VSAREQGVHVATGDAGRAVPADASRPVEAPTSGAEKVEVTGPAVDAEVLQAVVDFIDDLVESDESDDATDAIDVGATGGADGRADGEVPPNGRDT